MSAKLNQVIEEVKHLTAQERALVAHCLISSLETKQDEGVDMAWAELAEKRYNELLTGTVKSVSWEQIKVVTLLLIVFMTVIVSASGYAFAGSNFVAVRLPNGVSIDIPRNWQVATSNQRITLDTAVESQLDLSSLPKATSDLGFVAGYFDDAGDKAKINVRYYPDIKVTQDTVRRASPNEIVEFDTALKQSIFGAMKSFGGTILHWGGTRKQDSAGRVALLTEYRRSANPGEQGSFNVRLIRILDGSRSFTLTVSYNEMYTVIFKPICDRVISSLKIRNQ